jgi:uncharacterized protein YegP (UPF0339 family)
MPAHRRHRGREPAGAHFRRLGQSGEAGAACTADSLGATRCQFEVYRADEVRMTTTLFAGGDWHWRLRDQTGKVLVDAGGYCDERTCREAIALLKGRAAHAAVAPCQC